MTPQTLSAGLDLAKFPIVNLNVFRRVCVVIISSTFGAFWGLEAIASDTCFRGSETEVITQTDALDKAHASLFVVSVSTRGNAQFGLAGARVIIFDRSCRSIYEQKFPKASEAHFETVTLGSLPLLVITALSPGVSQDEYEHVLLTYQGGISALGKLNLSHSNMGGLDLGHVGPNGMLGMVHWDAIWEGAQSHYEPHRYEVSLWAWRNGRFFRSKHWTTPDKFDPTDAEVYSKLGVATRNLTEPKRFKLTLDAKYQELAPDR
jgi:hypothetical protein